MSDSKPDLVLDKSGICSACRNYENRSKVDWDLRKRELVEILSRFKNKNNNQWDCIIPVSGGKDSTYQVLKVLELGFNPLCITSTTCDESTIGRKNILNLANLGVDHVQISPNPLIRSK